jgi:hypothetical protein
VQRLLRWRRRARLVVAATSAAQRVARGFLGRRRSRAARLGVVVLQARFRGSVARAAASKNRRVLQVRAKLARAAARAAAQPELRLGNRTVAALEALRTGKMLSDIMLALATLEVSTRLSPPCAASFAAGGAASVLLKVASTCNRSTPHQEIVRSVLATLCHVAAQGYGHDMVRVVCAAGIQGGAQAVAEAVAELVVNFRDREAIFCLGVDLVTALCVEPAFRAATAGDRAKRIAAAAGANERKLATKVPLLKTPCKASAPKAPPPVPRVSKNMSEACAKLKVGELLDHYTYFDGLKILLFFCVQVLLEALHA